jgi:hypothetical protein
MSHPVGQSAKRATLAAVYELPASLAFAGSCLGTETPVRIAGVDGVMRLPTLAWPSDNEPRIGAPVLSDLPPLAQRWLTHRAENDPSWFWGTVDKWHPPSQEVLVAEVGAVVLLVNAADATGITYANALQGRGWPKGAPVDQIFADIDGWFERLRLWVRALVNQDVDADVRAGNVSVAAQGLQLLTVDGDTVSSPRFANSITVNMQDIDPLDQQTWERALSLTNRGASLPVEWSLVGSARVQLHLRQFRRAVADASAAVELGLGRYLNAHASALPAGLQTTLNEDAQTLGWLIKSVGANRNLPAPVASVWQQFPLDTVSALLDVRNDVVHRNRSVTYAAAKRAVEIATEVVKLVAPLPA